MRIMAIDYGDAHTGIAISDLTGFLAGYTTTIHSRRPEQVLDAVGELIRAYGVTELVLGYPKNMDGTLGPRAEKAEQFAAALGERTVSLERAELSRGAVVIGSEGRGVSPALLVRCGQTIKIPMRERCESLNAAAAAAIVLWEMARRT